MQLGNENIFQESLNLHLTPFDLPNPLLTFSHSPRQLTRLDRIKSPKCIRKRSQILRHVVVAAPKHIPSPISTERRVEHEVMVLEPLVDVASAGAVEGYDWKPPVSRYGCAVCDVRGLVAARPVPDVES